MDLDDALFSFVDEAPAALDDPSFWRAAGPGELAGSRARPAPAKAAPAHTAHTAHARAPEAAAQEEERGRPQEAWAAAAAAWGGGEGGHDADAFAAVALAHWQGGEGAEAELRQLRTAAAQCRRRVEGLLQGRLRDLAPTARPHAAARAHAALLEAEEHTWALLAALATPPPPPSPPLAADARLARLLAVQGWLEARARQALEWSGEGQAWRGPRLDADAAAEGAGEEAREERLLLQLWRLTRAGARGEAVALCREAGQAWRAASISGGPLAAPARNAWRAAAAATAAAAASPVEAALYAALAATRAALPAALAMCASWEDCLWAHLRVAVAEAQDELLEAVDAVEARVPPPARPQEARLTLEEIFGLLEQNDPEGAAEPFHVLQRHAVLGSAGAGLAQLLQAVPQGATFCAVYPRELLRHCVHLELHLRRHAPAALACVPPEARQALLLEYVEALQAGGAGRLDQRQAQAVALYLALLELPAAQEGRRTAAVAAFFARAVRREERAACLALAEKLGLDYSAVALSVARSLVAATRAAPPAPPTLPSATDEEQRQAAALEWLLFYPQHLREALLHANVLLRYFVGHGRLAAARLVVEQLESDEFRAVVMGESGGEDVQLAQARREFLQLHALLEATRLYEAAAASPSAAEEAEARLREMLEDRPGWLVDGQAAAPALRDGQRADELLALRRQYVPNLAVMLHSLLLRTRPARAMAVADLVADEETRLYTLFGAEGLRAFLHLLRNSKVALLEQQRRQ